MGLDDDLGKTDPSSLVGIHISENAFTSHFELTAEP
jgi:hypothetical protein